MRLKIYCARQSTVHCSYLFRSGPIQYLVKDNVSLLVLLQAVVRPHPEDVPPVVVVVAVVLFGQAHLHPLEVVGVDELDVVAAGVVHLKGELVRQGQTDLKW